jgi:hypothetical protein
MTDLPTKLLPITKNKLKDVNQLKVPIEIICLLFGSSDLVFRTFMKTFDCFLPLFHANLHTLIFFNLLVFRTYFCLYLSFSVSIFWALDLLGFKAIGIETRSSSSRNSS